MLSRMKSTKYTHHNIEQILVLLKKTNTIAWVRIQISTNNLELGRIGQGEQFEKATIHMPEGRMKNLPGLVLIACTQLKRTVDLVIGTDPAGISKE